MSFIPLSALIPPWEYLTDAETTSRTTLGAAILSQYEYLSLPGSFPRI